MVGDLSLTYISTRWKDYMVQSEKPAEKIQPNELVQAIGEGPERAGLDKIIISSMSFKEYLDYCVTHYYSKVIESLM
jgi:hypothetical protein